MFAKKSPGTDLPGKRTLIKSIVSVLNAKTSDHKLVGPLAVERIENGLKASKKRSIAWLWETLQEVL